MAIRRTNFKGIIENGLVDPATPALTTVRRLPSNWRPTATVGVIANYSFRYAGEGEVLGKSQVEIQVQLDESRVITSTWLFMVW